jgi:hypothetical protein
MEKLHPELRRLYPLKYPECPIVIYLHRSRCWPQAFRTRHQPLVPDSIPNLILHRPHGFLNPFSRLPTIEIPMITRSMKRDLLFIPPPLRKHDMNRAESIAVPQPLSDAATVLGRVGTV